MEEPQKIKESIVDCVPAKGILDSLPKQRLGKGHVINNLAIFLGIQTRSNLSHIDRTVCALMKVL